MCIRDSTYVGGRTGQNNVTGIKNTFIGESSGLNNTGSSNTFLGYRSGLSETGSNKLYIDNSGVTIPLIYGDFATNQVGINTKTIPSDYALGVQGKIITTEVRVLLAGDWPDYVFAEEYDLMPIEELEEFIQDNKHLPDVPSSNDIETQGGHDIGDMNKILLKKVEELSLYVIQLKQELEALKNK